MSDALKTHISAMNNTAVLVVGDIMLDRFVYGAVDRISPESPVPVLNIKREDAMLGGAGNAMANLIGLKVKTFALSVIGDDAEGQSLKDMADKLGIDTRGLIVDPSRPTIVKTRYLAGHQQLLRADYERKESITHNILDQALKTAQELIKDVQAVILSDYGKGLLQPALIEGIIATARAQNIPVIVDPKGQDFSIYRGASAVTPNKKELSEATRGAATDTDDDIIAAAETIIQECGIAAVIATRSADGISVIQQNAAPVHFKGANIEVFDVSGAGDTVIATIAGALATGASLPEAAQLANLAGTIAVTKVGTTPIRADELVAGLDDTDLTNGNHTSSEERMRKAPVLSWEEAAEQVKRWKARGLKVGFTNGCFDILHYGHVSYLQNARERCDRLIIGLNHDKSVKILKGESRPVHDENSRAAVLGALGSVDMVTLFGAVEEGGDNTAIKLLELVQPDIYFKGGDYTVDQIPEAPTVMNYGGTVDVMPVYEGHSTTNSIKKIEGDAA